MSNDASIFGKIILPLVFFVLIAGIIVSDDLRDYFIDSLQAMINFILQNIFGNPDDLQIARDSTAALACATDVVSRYQGETPPTQDEIKTNAVILFKDLPSCKGIQQSAPITASVIAGNSITGRLFEPAGANQCGATDCGVIFKDDCLETERCISKWGGWYCEQDSTCKTSKDNTKDLIAAGAQGMCFGQKSRTCTVCGRYTLSEEEGPKIFCNVIGFELPQDVEVNNGIIPTLLDYGRMWIGATGQPKYLVYFETFPEYAEIPWTYKGSDILVHAFVVGAVSNLGIGGVKVAGSLVKNGYKYAFATVLKKGVEKQLDRKLAVEAIKKRAIKEFGGKEAERLFVLSLVGKDLVGTAASETLMKQTQKRVFNLVGDSAEYHPAVWKKFFHLTDDEWTTLQGKNADELKSALAEKLDPTIDEYGFAVTGAGQRVSDMTGYVFGTGKDLTRDEMKDLVTHHTGISQMTNEELDQMVADINKMRAKVKAGTLITPEIRTAIKTELLTGDASKYRDFVNDIEVLESKAFLETQEKAGILSSVKNFKRSFIPAKVVDIDKKVDHTAIEIYNRWMWEIWNEGGNVGVEKVIGTKTLKSDWYLSPPDAASKIEWVDLRDAVTPAGVSLADAKLSAFVAKWNNLPADRTYKSEVWKRGEQLIRGTGVMPYDGYPGWKRTAVMTAAIAAAAASMQMDSQAEKYKICGKDALCLNWPKQWFTVGNKVEDNPYLSYNTKSLEGKWVQLVIPSVTWDEGEALALASPCKANIVVTPDTCECKYFADNDKVHVVFSRNKIRESIINSEPMTTTTSVLKDGDIKLPCDTDGCHATKGLPEIKAFPGPLSDYIGDMDPTSPLMKDINTILKSTTYLNDGGLPNYYTSHPEGSDNHEHHSWETLYTSDATIQLFDSTQLSYMLLNVRPMSVKDPADPFGTPVTVPTTFKACVKKGFWDKASFLWGSTYPTPQCITMSVDSASMTGYKNAGFTPNYCRENKAKLDDVASVGIEVGLVVGSIALVFVFPPAGAAGAAAIMGVSGAAGGLGEAAIAWWDITDRWPADQSG